MKKAIFAALFLILLLSGCMREPAVEQPREYFYQTQEITYSESNAQYGFRVNMDSTETVYARYFFEPTIEVSERAKCIESTDRILAEQISLGLQPEIYVFTEDRYPNTFAAENKVYLSVQDWQTVEYAANVLLAAYGPYSHYGLAYGYASLICDKTNPDSPFIMPNVADAADLSLLCFDSAFVSESDIATVKSLACNFALAYAAGKGEAALQELLSASDTASGAQNVSDALAQFYRDNGVDYTPPTLRYGFGGHSFDYIVSADLATFYIKKDWADMNAPYNPLVYDGFLHQDYADTKAFFQTNLTQMQQYQALFALDSYNNDLTILFANTNLSKYSFYQSNTHIIYVKNVDSLMHEYIHALTQPGAGMKAWEIEGFARYFSYRYDHYGIALLNRDYNNAAETPELKYIHEYRDTIQRPIDMAIDYDKIENIAVWSRSLKNPNANYLAGSSFVQYLVNQYGEQAVIRSIYGDKTPLPKTYADLVRGWIGAVESSCQGYSKYDG
jgi:hypothetical protein